MPQARRLLLLILLYTACASLGCLGCSNSRANEDSKKPAKRAAPVTVALAERRDVPVELSAIGNVESYATVAIKARVTGEVQLVHIQDGQDVKQGDPLFTLDKRPFEAALREARAKLERDRTLSGKADEDLKRFSSLVGKGVVSVEQFENYKSQAEALRSSVRADEALAEKAALDLEYCHIRSPINGRTGQVLTNQGAMIKANDDNKNMLVIDQIEPIYVAFAVPESHLPAVQDAMRTGKPVVRAKPPTANYEPERGVLTFIDSNVDVKSGAIRLRAAFDNKNRRLWPGQFVDVVLELGVERGVIVAPSQTVQNGLEGLYAFVIDQESNAQLRRVKVGRSHDGITVLLDGVAAGERIVTDGHLRLAPGVPVEIKNEAKPVGAAK
jgi:multidrug efflux system membrane fusion protein